MLRRNFILVTLLFVVGIFQGCMPNVTPYKPAKVLKDKVLIYVYRPEGILQRGVGWSIRVNGKIVHKYFINNAYVPVYAEPGDIEVAIMQYSYPHGVYDKVIIKDAKPSSIYYIKAVGGAFASNTLQIVDNKIAQKEIVGTEYYEDVKE